MNTPREQRRREILARTPRSPGPPDAMASQERAACATSLELQLVVHGVHVADARRAAALIRSAAPDERLRHCLVVQAPDGWAVLHDVNGATAAGQHELRELRRRGLRVKSIADFLRERGWSGQLAA